MSSERASGRYSTEQLPRKFSKNLWERTCARVFFIDVGGLQEWALKNMRESLNFDKRVSVTGVFQSNWRYFPRQPPDDDKKALIRIKTERI